MVERMQMMEKRLTQPMADRKKIELFEEYLQTKDMYKRHVRDLGPNHTCNEGLANESKVDARAAKKYSNSPAGRELILDLDGLFKQRNQRN